MAGVGVNLELLVELTVGMRVSQSLVGRPTLGLRVAGGLACRRCMVVSSPVEWKQSEGVVKSGVCVTIKRSCHREHRASVAK